MARVLLVHLSDLHIGSDFAGTRGSSSGTHGHHLLYCEKLADALADLFVVDFPAQAGDVHFYLVGGDLTRTGSNHDFHLAYGFLFGQWPIHDLHNRHNVGCQLPMTDFVSIPGNHDHWNGFVPGFIAGGAPAYRTGIFPRFFDQTPWPREIPAGKPDFMVELHGIDSNEGLRGRIHNTWAWGRFTPLQNPQVVGDPQDTCELSNLDKQLQQSLVNEKADGIPRIRAVLCHHAFDKGKQPGRRYARPLQQPSLTELLLVAHRGDVTAVLTGHTHDFDCQPNNGMFQAKPHVLREVRCGTTTQVDPPKIFDVPGFYVHEIKKKGTQITWEAWQFSFVKTVVDANGNVVAVNRFVKPKAPIQVR